MSGNLKLDAQADIDHFLANAFMMMNFEVSEFEIPNEDRERMLHLLKVAHATIAHQNLFMGGKPELLMQEVRINEIIENALMINEEIGGQGKFKSKPLEKDLFVEGDRYYLNEAFKFLIASLFEKCTEVNFEINEDRELVIKVKSTDGLPELYNDLLAHYLSKDLFTNNDLFYQCALKIFALQGIGVEVDNKCIRLHFNSAT